MRIFSYIMINMYSIKYKLFVVVYQDNINICKVMIETINIIIFVVSYVQMFMPFTWTHGKDSFKVLSIGRTRNIVHCCTRWQFKNTWRYFIILFNIILLIFICSHLLFYLRFRNLQIAKTCLKYIFHLIFLKCESRYYQYAFKMLQISI